MQCSEFRHKYLFYQGGEAKQNRPGIRLGFYFKKMHYTGGVAEEWLLQVVLYPNWRRDAAISHSLTEIMCLVKPLIPLGLALK